MKYTKGSFITVPNKEIIRKQKPSVQTLFMWLCHYANTTGECFPSRRTLAEDCGMSMRVVDSALNTLIEIGIVEKSPQFQSNRQTTNLYSVNIGVQNLHGGECRIYTLGGAESAHRTQLIRTQSIGTQRRNIIPRKEMQNANADLRESIKNLGTSLRVPC